MRDAAFTFVAFVCVAGAWALWGLAAARRARRNLAGVRLVTCPETGRAAAVRFDLARAARTAFARDEPEARLADCSRWAVRGPCDQACVKQAQSPDHAVVAIIERWSADQRCALCGQALIEAPLTGRHIALLSPDGMTSDWPDVPPEELPDALRTRRPVCWNCHIAETFRRQHPDLVTNR